MRIGDLAKIVGVPVATIRYYEHEGLIEQSERSDSNYRRYGSETVARLGFIRRCRTLGMSLTEIRRLLKLTEAPDANCGEVDVLLDEHISNVREQRRNLARLEQELRTLRDDCHTSRQVRGCGILRDSALIAQGKADCPGSTERPCGSTPTAFPESGRSVTIAADGSQITTILVCRPKRVAVAAITRQLSRLRHPEA